METDKKVKLSILIATCDRPEMLDACVKSLLIQKPENTYEIIILDQTDTRKQTISFPNEPAVKIVKCDFKNKSCALNRGVGLALADYIAVIDDDCVADKRWIDSMYKVLQDERDAIITGRVVAGNKEGNALQSRLHDNLTKRVVYQKRKVTPIFKLSGCNFGFHRMMYKAIGPFDERFGPGSVFKSADDNEWSYRALHLGLQLIYTPWVVVTHRSWRNHQDDTQLMKDYGFASGAFFRLILNNSKSDFLYHSYQLWRWLFKIILFSFSLHEIRNHINYGVFFLRGFLTYHHDVKNKEIVDCIFVLSPGKYIGGAERYTQSLAHEFYKCHHLNVIIAISHNQRFYSECKADSVPSIYLGNTLGEASFALSRLLKDIVVKSIISNGYHSSYTVFLARCRNLFKNSECKFIDIKHGWITTNVPERLKTFLDKLTAILYDYIILVNPLMENGVWCISKKKKVFIPSGISIKENITRERQKSNLLKVLIIGRIAEEKNFGLVIEALSYIPKNLWWLTVVGNGSNTDNLRQTISKNNIDDRVQFLGYQRNIEQFYQNADLLIISSVSEGCPLVALEAMVNEVLVLSTDVGYMPTLLDDNRGFLVSKNIAPKELSKKIEEIAMLNNGTVHQILQRARNYIYEHHNLAKNAEIFKNLIFNLTNS